MIADFCWVTISKKVFSDDEYLRRLVDINPKAVRINCGRENPEWIRSTVKKLITFGYPCNKILLDIANQKPRISIRSNPLIVNMNDSILISNTPSVHADCYLSDDIFDVVKTGDILYFGDGQVTGKLVDTENDSLKTIRIINSGHLSDRMAIGIIGGAHRTFTLEKSETTWVNELLQEYPVGLILSFVISQNDILLCQKIFTRATCIVPKIETLNAIIDIENIMEVSSTILIGRGDLSLDVGIEKIGFIQNYLISKAVRNNVKVIVGTGTLRSLIDNQIPNPCEIVDITNSFMSGVSGILLTDETAGSSDPFRAIEYLMKTVEYLRNSRKIK